MKHVIVLGLFLGLFLGSYGISPFVQTVYTAYLTPEGVVPSHGPAGAIGLAVCILNRNESPYIMDCEVQCYLDSRNGPFRAAIFRGGPFETGPALYNFTTKVDNNFRQRFAIQSLSLADEKYSVSEQEYDFLNGNWYLAITSDPYLLGNIRGQLSHDTYIYARLSANNILPAFNESLTEIPTTTGLALATFTSYNPRRVAQFTIVHNIDFPTGVHIRRGNENEVGGADASFKNSFESPIRQSINYVYSTQKALLDLEQYLEISSVEYPTGEVRGQLYAIDQVPPISFTTRLDSVSMIPSTLSAARGCGLFYVNCATMELQYLIFHTVDTPTLGYMYQGSPYVNGQKVWPLARGASPIYGSRQLSADEILEFYNEDFYVVIESELYPNGEIRGQVSDKYPYYAYLTGTQVVPPRTTSSLGCATFRLAEETLRGRVVDYDIVFELRNDVGDSYVELIFGDVGATGGDMIARVPRQQSPASGTDVWLTKEQESLFATGQMFISVGQSSQFVKPPEIRGQVRQIFNSCPFETQSIEEPASTPTSSWFKYAVQDDIDWGAGASLVPNLLAIFVLVLAVLYY